MDIEELETRQKYILEDSLYIFKKLEDENTYRIHETSPEMAASINNLIAAITRNLNEYKGL